MDCTSYQDNSDTSELAFKKNNTERREREIIGKVISIFDPLLPPQLPLPCPSIH
jgi:hypothetical protein